MTIESYEMHRANAGSATDGAFRDYNPFVHGNEAPLYRETKPPKSAVWFIYSISSVACIRALNLVRLFQI